MNLLILGGSRFLGRHLVEVALARGHDVTVFNRGRRGDGLDPSVEQLRGDRHGDLAALVGRSWNAVIDCCGFVPNTVSAAARLLAESVEHYTFISSISAYAEFSARGMDEHAELGTLSAEELHTAEAVRSDGDVSSTDYAGLYGPLKARCEQAAEDAMPGRVLTIRPGLIVGPFDPTGRFSYWPLRLARCGAVLAPGRPERQVQFIDVRDLSAWILHLVETRRTGIFNATGPQHPLTMQQLLRECRKEAGCEAQLHWVEDHFLEEADVAAATELPLWIPDSWTRWAGFMTIDCRKAIATGLVFRPLRETIRDTLAWESTRPVTEQRGAAMTAEREAELLALWRHGASRRSSRREDSYQGT